MDAARGTTRLESVPRPLPGGLPRLRWNFWEAAALASAAARNRAAATPESVIPTPSNSTHHTFSRSVIIAHGRQASSRQGGRLSRAPAGWAKDR